MMVAKIIFRVALAEMFLLMLVPSIAHASPTNVVNTADERRISNDVVSIGISSAYGGAINSVRFNNKEFINNHDHGRQLQIAWSVDNKAEAHNPTEAGNRHDTTTSSSVLRSVVATGNALETTTIPAFWQNPGEVPGTDYSNILTRDKIQKNVTIGYNGDRGLIQFKTVIFTSASYQQLEAEVPTGYLVSEFTKHYTFDPELDVLKDVSRTLPKYVQKIQGHWDPLILATADGEFAMGVWVSNLENFAGYGESPYVSDRPNDFTHKWAIVYKLQDVSAGAHRFTGYISVGNLSAVRASLRRLYTSEKATWIDSFDYQYYLKANPDVAAVFPTAESARWHWVNVGKREGRKARP